MGYTSKSAVLTERGLSEWTDNYSYSVSSPGTSSHHRLGSEPPLPCSSWRNEILIVQLCWPNIRFQMPCVVVFSAM